MRLTRKRGLSSSAQANIRPVNSCVLAHSWFATAWLRLKPGLQTTFDLRLNTPRLNPRFQNLPMSMIPRSKIQLHARPIIDWRSVIHRRWIIPRRRVSGVIVPRNARNAIGVRVRLSHIKIDPLRDMVFRGKEVAGAKDPRLDILIRSNRQDSNNVIVQPKISEGSIPVPAHLQQQ